jgi:hypothetical protein
MSNKHSDSDQSPLEKFEERRRALRRSCFGPRVEGHMSWAVGSDLLPHNVWPLHPADKSRIAEAIRAAFPDFDPLQQEIVLRSYRDCFKDLPIEDALVAIEKRFANPGDAMRAKVIPNRRFIGFWGQWRHGSDLPEGFFRWPLRS